MNDACAHSAPPEAGSSISYSIMALQEARMNDACAHSAFSEAGSSISYNTSLGGQIERHLHTFSTPRSWVKHLLQQPSEKPD